MGFRFRKSVSFLGGAFRINFSKSGIGYSFGGKGARITKTATGRTRTTLSVPGTGISYVTESSSQKKKRKKATKPMQENDIKKGGMIFLFIVFYIIVCAAIGFIEATLIALVWALILSLIKMSRIKKEIYSREDVRRQYADEE